MTPETDAPETDAPADTTAHAALADLDEIPAPAAPAAGPPSGSILDLLADVELEVTVELGRCRLPLAEVARLGVGSVVELDALAGEPLVVYANGRRVATGEAVVVDGQFGVRVQEVSPR